MYLCITFLLTWRTSNFDTKFTPRNMDDKYFEKISIKFEIGNTLVPDCSQFGGLQFLGPNLPKKHLRVKYKDKRNMRVTYFKFLSKKYNVLFQVVSGWF